MGPTSDILVLNTLEQLTVVSSRIFKKFINSQFCIPNLDVFTLFFVACFTGTFLEDDSLFFSVPKQPLGVETEERLSVGDRLCSAENP